MALNVNDLMRALVADLAEGDVPDPLYQPCTLAIVWADLAMLAGEPLPADVAAVLATPVPVRRGSYRDHAAQFPELYVIPRGDLTITDILARCPHPTRR